MKLLPELPPARATQPASGAAASAAAGDGPSPPMSVADWNAAAEAADEAAASGSQPSAGAESRPQRIWPAIAAAAAKEDPPAGLPEQLAKMLQLSDDGVPMLQRPGLPEDAAMAVDCWNASADGSAGACQRAFPCPAEAPRAPLVSGLAAACCRDAGNNFRQGVAWSDTAGRLSFVQFSG